MIGFDSLKFNLQKTYHIYENNKYIYFGHIFYLKGRDEPCSLRYKTVMGQAASRERTKISNPESLP